MTVSDYMFILARLSETKESELVVECLEYFDILGTKDLTVEQSREFVGIVCEKKGLHVEEVLRTYEKEKWINNAI